MLGSKSARYTTGRALLFGLVGGCFTVLVSAIAGCIFWLAGLFSPGAVSTTVYWLLGIFGVSSVTVFLAIMDIESFLEP